MYVWVDQAFALRGPTGFPVVYRRGHYLLDPLLLEHLEGLRRDGWILLLDGLPLMELREPEGAPTRPEPQSPSSEIAAHLPAGPTPRSAAPPPPSFLVRSSAEAVAASFRGAP